jgi:hypothetical protein
MIMFDWLKNMPIGFKGLNGFCVDFPVKKIGKSLQTHLY